MTQLEIPFSAAARREAYDGAKKKAIRTREAVLEVFKILGSATADDIAQYLNLHPYIIRPRLTELKQLGKIRAIGRRRGVYGISITLWKMVYDQN